VRHLLAQLTAAPHIPDSARAWEQLWSSTPAEQLPWHAAALDPVLDDAIAAHSAPGRRLLDLGTGDGIVAIAAARRGFRVTALDVAPTALGRARERADRAQTRSILFVLDDITAPRLDIAHDIAVDRGLLHSLPHDSWPAYSAAVTRLVSPGGALLLVAHAPGTAPGTHPLTAHELSTLLPAFALMRTLPTTLTHAPAHLFELEHRADSGRCG